jgi:hypothetical protein
MRAILCAMLVPALVLGQRKDADLEWQKHHAKIDYNVVGVGKHKLDELQVGGNWRMGQNGPSTLTTDMALIVGDAVVVPGVYRVGVHRAAENEFAFMIEGASVGSSPQAAPTPADAKGALGKPEKPNKALEVTFKPDGKASNTVQPAKVTVTYGENQLTAMLSAVGMKAAKSNGWTLDAFQLPADFVDKRFGEAKALPIACLKKETGKKDNPFYVWNLTVTKDTAELWQAPVAPKDAFAGVDGMSAATMSKATSIKWDEAKDSKDSKAVLEVSKFEVVKGKGATIMLSVGKQSCTIVIPEPKVPE